MQDEHINNVVMDDSRLREELHSSGDGLEDDGPYTSFEEQRDAQMRIEGRDLQTAGWPETLVAALFTHGGSFTVRIKTGEEIWFSKARKADYSLDWVRLLGIHHMDTLQEREYTIGLRIDSMDLRVRDIVWIAERSDINEPF